MARFVASHPANIGHATLVDWADPGLSLPHSRPRLGRVWSARTVIAAIGATAGLVGWLLAVGLGAAATNRPKGAGQSAAAGHSTAATPAVVQVDGAALVGQPVAAVRQQLTRLGLQVRVFWLPGDHQPPGTVVSLHPVGSVPVGSTVIVTAVRSHGGGQHRHGDGNGNGNNGGGGD